MSLLAEAKGGGDFTITPEGQYIGRCYRILDMGTQTITGAFGTSDKPQVMISWELIGPDDQKMEDGKPYSVHQKYTVSLHEKSNLRKHLEAWRGVPFSPEELRGFNLSKVLNQYCMIQVVHSEDGQFANIQAIMAYKGDKPKPVNDNVVFDIDKPDMKVFEALSDNMKAKITNTPEWAAYENPPKPAITATQQQQKEMGTLESEPMNVDDIPF